jgi:hypothetical protein
MEALRGADVQGTDQPRTHCARAGCGKMLTKFQRKIGQQHCCQDCLAQAQNWTRTPDHAECLFCGAALNYDQRKSGCRYCCPQHANLARAHGTWDAWVAATNLYLDTRDTWERIAPRMTEPPESQKDWEIQQVIREETRRWGHR